MAPKHRRRAFETNTAPELLREEGASQMPPDSAPKRDEPASDYERELDRLDAAVRARI